MSERTTVTWRDVGTRERLTVLASLTDTPPTDTLAALRAMSNAVVTTYHTGPVQSPEWETGVPEIYPDLDDEWIITGQDAGGYRTQLYIPAPNVGTCIADNVNYSAATSEWIAIEAALAAVNVPYTGAAIQQVIAATIARDGEATYQPWTNFTNTIDWARRTIQWFGVHGTARLTHLVAIDDSLGDDFDTVMAALAAVSVAVPAHYWEGPMSVFADEPTTDQYNSVRDAAGLTFEDDLGCLSEIFLPAPFRSIFLADGKTVDPTNADVETLVAAVLAELIVPVSGLAPSRFVGGRLSKQPVL